ncbi:MAG: AAA family ATPase [Acidobacteria bacterium]|nr:AAA family ATPase [Acidobacteriota bacterium]
MNSNISLTQTELIDFLVHVAMVRPVFIWGAPGIGKSSLVERFAAGVGLPCVSLLGSQLAPEDLIGVPQILEGVSRFCPPRTIARAEPYCLFLDELNACSHEIQKAFYSLIHDRRLGEYELPKGSVVVGAGNRAQDSAIVRPMSSALINRMVHVHLRVSHRDWLAWAQENNLHPAVLEYIHTRPDHLWTQPPKHEDTFSSPRSWHMLSDALREYGPDAGESVVEALAHGTLSPDHATQFKAFVKQKRSRFRLSAILDGEMQWPHEPQDRDLLYFLSQAFRAQLLKELPEHRESASGGKRDLVHRSKAALRSLAAISLEMAQMVVVSDPSGTLPNWYLVEVVRDLPRLAAKKE